MKKLIIHSIPVVISCIWLVAEFQTFNPIRLKGPEFLKFYSILIVGFYISIFIVKSRKEIISRVTIYFTVLILGVGIIKLIRGIILGKPIGFLALILMAESIVVFLLMSWKLNDKIKQ